ncbi:MAG: hypothetical protein V4574_18850 [Pseudomonadota bacterium]
MAGATLNGNESNGFPWRVLGWGGAALLLLLPLVLRAPWTLSDFIVAGVMLGTAGLVLELAVRSSASLAYRVGAGLAVAASFLLVWVNGAVGFLGDEGNPANLVFAAVLGIALLGSVIAGFRPAGMARAMFAAAAAQLLIGAIAIPLGWASPGNAGLFEVVIGTTLFTSLWLVAGALFRKAAA